MPLSLVQRIQRRAKESERGLARFLVKYDGIDPRYIDIASSTGRIGHLGFMFDVPSIHYDGENKNTRVPAALWKQWKQICAIALSHRKYPMIRLEPSNLDKKGIPIMHIISEERHAILLTKERIADGIKE